MIEKQLEKATAGAPVDAAYGSTPEEALMGVLALHPELDHQDAYYHGKRPPFMSVKATRGFTDHDWQQYEQPEGAEALVEGPTRRRAV